MEKQQPFFSIVVASYNRPAFLQKCIDSVLKSDFRDFEIIVSDDCSPKAIEIAAVMGKYSANKNILFFLQAKNLGEPENRNFMVQKASGKFIIPIGDDDELYPYSLSRIKEYVEANSEIDLFGLGYSIIDEKENIVFSQVSPKAFEISLQYPPLAKKLFVSGIVPFWVFHPLTLCFKRSIWEETKYNKAAFTGEDLLFLFDCLNKGKRIFVIPESLFLYRRAFAGNREYKNFGSGINNIRARANVFLLLQKRTDLQTFIKKLVSSASFKREFIFDQLSSNKTITETVLKQLKEEKQLAVLIGGYRKNSFSRIRISVLHLFEYFRMFGVKGTFFVFKNSFLRFLYSLKT